MQTTSDDPPQVIVVPSVQAQLEPRSVAPNLALRAGMRARGKNRKVCFVDTTVNSPLAKLIGLKNGSLDSLEELSDQDDVDRCLLHHVGWNLYLLPGPTTEDPGNGQQRIARYSKVLPALRERFEYIFVAASIPDLYRESAQQLLGEAEMICLEVPDNVATALNIAMWLRSYEEGAERGTPVRTGLVLVPQGGHLTLPELRNELPGVRHLGTLPKAGGSRSMDPTVLAATHPDPGMSKALDTMLYEATSDLTFKPSRKEWWREG